MIGPALLLLGAYLPVSPGGDMFMLPKLVAIFAGASVCLYQCKKRQEHSLRPYFLVWLAVMALSASSAQSWLGLYRSPTAGILGAVAVWLSYEAGLVSDRTAWRWVPIGAAICSALALAQLIPGSPWHGLVPNGRAIGTIGSPPFLGCMLTLALPVSGPAWPVIVLALLATRSKAAILGAIAGVAVSRRVPAWALALGALVTVVALNRGASDTTRIYIWSVAWRTFLAHPMLGVGADNFGDAFITLRDATWLTLGERGAQSGSENAHNLLLNVLATGGLVGLAARGLLAWRAWPAVRDDRALLACYASVLVYSCFNPVPMMAWAVLAFMMGSLGI